MITSRRLQCIRCQGQEFSKDSQGCCAGQKSWEKTRRGSKNPVNRGALVPVCVSVEAEEGRSQALRGVREGQVGDRRDTPGMIVVLQMCSTWWVEV